MSWARDADTGLVLPESAKPSQPAGSRKAIAQALREDFLQLIADVGHDKLGHAMVVAGGEFHWRACFTKEYGACWNGNRSQCDTAADTLYRVLIGLWRRKYPGESAQSFLDAVHVPKPLSEREQEQEIEDGWRVDIASSEESFSKHYVGSARHRTGPDAFSTFWQRPQK